MTGPWDAVGAALDRAQEVGRRVEVWLRDDDAIAATPALERLTDLCTTVGMPVLLAVIPASADTSLARFVARHTVLTPTQHGFAHRNHAPQGERARELGGMRALVAILEDLASGGHRLDDLFDGKATNILVPPWNRIDATVVPRLPGLGFKALSAFGPDAIDVPGLGTINCDLDIIDWRNGRRGRTIETLCGKLTGLIEGGAAIGLLTHHLAHDEAAWAFLDFALPRLAAHNAVRFTSADTLCDTMVAPS